MRRSLSSLALALALLTVGAAPVLAASSGTPEAFATTIQDMRYEPSENAIYLPFEGPRPAVATISGYGRSLIIDLGGTGFPYTELYGKVEHSTLLKAYVAAFDPEIRGVHLVFEGTVPLVAEADTRYRGKELKFVLRPRDPQGQARLVEPTNVRQLVTVVPRSGAARTYTIEPPLATPAFPSPDLQVWIANTTEQYSPDALQGSAPTVGRYVASWEPVWGAWSLPLRLGRGGYAFDDPDYVGVTHTRVETSLAAAVMRRLSWSAGHWDVGLGYEATINQVLSNATVASPTFYFADPLVTHGPMLRTAAEGGIFGPIGWGVSAEWTPWAFAQTGGASGLPWLTELRVETRLVSWPDHRLTAGIFYDRLVGSTLNRESAGLTLGMNFTSF